MSVYDANGRMQAQRAYKADGALKYDVMYDQYDNVGNLVQHRLVNHDGTAYTITYTTGYQRRAGYQTDRVVATSSTTALRPGSTYNRYDVNGFLLGIDDTTKASNSRTLVNDAEGRVLLRTQDGRSQRQLLASGQLLGEYGMGLDAAKPRTDQGEPNIVRVGRFGRSHEAVGGARVGQYVVRGGETLQGIAQAVYGDARQWYRIAEANGMSGGATLRAGETLTLPAVGSTYNGAESYRAYEASEIVGDASPNLPAAPPRKRGCGVLGKILVLVVTIAVMWATVGAATHFLPAIGKVGAAVLGGMAGSIVGQGVAIATGVQDKFSWKSVALAGLGAGVTAGLAAAAGAGANGGLFGIKSPYLEAAVRQATSNVVTQGVAIAAGLQEKFDWRSVALSAVTAPLNKYLSTKFEGTDLGKSLASQFGDTGRDIATGILTGTATQLVRMQVYGGGKIDWATVAADAFGNAIGNAITKRLSAPPPVAASPDPLAATAADPAALEEVMPTGRRVAVDADLTDLEMIDKKPIEMTIAPSAPSEPAAEQT